jgi:hypothetical protein
LREPANSLKLFFSIASSTGGSKRKIGLSAENMARGSFAAQFFEKISYKLRCIRRYVSRIIADV